MSDTGVVRDPKVMEEFAESLRQFAAHTSEVHLAGLTDLGRLSETWDDEAFERFRSSFEGSAKRLEEATIACEQLAWKLFEDSRR